MLQIALAQISIYCSKSDMICKISTESFSVHLHLISKKVFGLTDDFGYLRFIFNGIHIGWEHEMAL